MFEKQAALFLHAVSPVHTDAGMVTAVGYNASVFEGPASRFQEELEKRWKGITCNPEATRGKMQKPEYTPRSVMLAKKWITLKDSE